MRGSAEVVYGTVSIGCYIRSITLHQRRTAEHSRGQLSEHEFHAKKLKKIHFLLQNFHYKDQPLNGACGK
jgi:hypothetical protein